MVDYKIAMASEYGDFIAEVEESLNEGWVCQGGVCVRTKEEGGWVYYQALTKTTE